MANEKIRILQIFYFLTQANDFVTSKEISEFVGVSERTVKSDMLEVEGFAKASGAVLYSKKGKGYALKTDDDTKFLFTKNQLEIYFSAIGVNDSVTITRVTDILRFIVGTNEFVSVDELAEKLYLTRSAIRDDIKSAKQFLNRFNLRIKRFNEAGDMVIGDELNKRLLMLCLFENHFHDGITLYKDSSFLKWFEYDDVKRKQLRKILLQILRESNIHIRDDHTQRISRYLCLMNHRYIASYRLTFNQDEVNRLKQLEEYSIASKVLATCHQYDNLVNDEFEVLGLTLLLSIWEDIPVNAINNYGIFVQESVKFVDLLLDRWLIDKTNKCSISSESKNILIACFIPIMIQNYFGISSHMLQPNIDSDVRLKLSSFAIYVASVTANIFNMEYNSCLSDYNILSIATSIHICLFKINYEYVKQKGIVCMSSGLEYSELIAQMVLQRYGKYIEKMDCYELYEIRGIDESLYDFCIAGFPQFAYKYEIPVLYVEPIPSEHQLISIYNKFIIKGVNVDKAIDCTDITMINIYERYLFSTWESFIELIAYKNGRNGECYQKIKDELVLQKTLLMQDATSVLFLPSDFTTGGFIDIYLLEEPQICNHKHIKNIIVIAANYYHCYQGLRLINDFAIALRMNPDAIDKLVNNPTISQVKEIVQSSFKYNPIALN